MRILVANDGLSDVGGVQSYLDAVLPGLAARGHTLAIAYCSDSGDPAVRAVTRRFETFPAGRDAAALAALRAWRPDVCFSHNVGDLALEQALLASFPVVKFMHGYFGTCAGGQKMHAFPARTACDRTFGPACAALYLPRHCCRWDPRMLVRDWRWASAQHALLPGYAAIVVASAHMRREYERHGVGPDRLAVNPLFPTIPAPPEARPAPAEPTILFLGRMTPLKGGDLLIRAAAIAERRLSRPVHLVMAGDGPARADWEALAARTPVRTTFTGWLAGSARGAWLERASLAALPSTWPEPFGLVGLEAAAYGVPTVAFAVGGIAEWLRDGENGIAVPPPPSAASLGEALAAALGDDRRLAALRAGARRGAAVLTLDAHLDRLEATLGAAGRRLLAVS